MKRAVVGALAAACAFVWGGQALAQEKLTVWWVKGFYKSEDDALFEAVKKFEQKTGVKVELSQYAGVDLISRPFRPSMPATRQTSL
jgi:multiple sugar transport system substrate-binding protein